MTDTMTTPHTPTPWDVSVEPAIGYAGSTETVRIIPTGTSEPILDAICTMWVKDGLDEHKANAALIVKAVNSLEALVEALNKLTESVESDAYESGGEFNSLGTKWAVDEARAALKLAGE